MEPRSWRTCIFCLCLGLLIFKLEQVTSDRCAMSQFQCTNERCIPNPWRCDEDDDCHDGSDEIDCPSKVCTETEFLCGDGKCIPKRWRCDNDEDCKDGSDESLENCRNNTCTEAQFSCGEGKSCIPKGWTCDGQEDCSNGADERGCTNKSCAADEYTCDNGKCITARWLCDQDNDCGDNSDEGDTCPTPTCSPSEVMCNDSRCIPERWKCDGDSDCTDNSDEAGCEAPTNTMPCSEREFTCGDHHCIHQSWQCDGDTDCTDGKDEEGCDPITCHPGEFQCKDKQCLPSNLQCNGKTDCGDGSDEEDCPEPTKRCDARTQYDCTGDGSNCIDRKLLCNNHNDCGNHEDESSTICNPDNNPCTKNNGGCSDTCLFMGNKSMCACLPGYKLANNSRTCNDLDECKEYGTCSQVCENTKGSFKCSCFPGYQLDPHTHMCKAIDHAYLLFANRHDIREMNLDNHQYREVIRNLRSAIALDYDFETKMVYWSDVALESIMATNITKSISLSKEKDIVKPTTVVNQTITADGLAFDWIHKNLYWTDTGDNSINVQSIKTQSRKKLISVGLDEPRAIVVDPRGHEGWMYWTDWGENAKIEKCGLDGSHRSTIINGSDMEWPNGLTIDYIGNRIYWVDAKLRIIASSDFYGKNRHTVLTSQTYLKHPFGIAVFEDLVYWTDWETESIHSANKFTGSSINTIVVGLHSPMDLQVYHPLKQITNNTTNYCAASNGGCSHLCLPAPYFNERSAKFVCACPDGWKMENDDKTCKGHETTTMIFNTSATTVAQPLSGNEVDRNSSDIYLSLNETESQNGTSNSSGSVSSGTTTTLPPTQSTGLATGKGGASTGKPNQQTNDDRKMAQEQNVGEIAGIVVGAITGVTIIIAIIGYLVYRSYVRRNIQSMNFDNPVYRKTTEDQFSLEKNQYQPSRTYPSTLEPLTSPTNELV